MRWSKIATGIGIAALPVCGLQAATNDTCSTYQGQTVQPITIDEAFDKFKPATLTKDEFETTAQFEARQQKAIGFPVNSLIIEKEVDPQYIKYNADTQ